MKKVNFCLVLLLTGVSAALCSTATFASENGGLMKEMMSDRYQPKVIIDTTKQERLNNIKLPSHTSGGLMKEMMGDRYQSKGLIDTTKQERLNHIKLSGHTDGGLMSQLMRVDNFKK